MPQEILSRAGMAYAHELSFMVCFAALTAERLMIRANPDQGTATKLIITDVIYGLAALTLLGSGIMRVLYSVRAAPSTPKIPCSGGRLVCTWLQAPSPFTPRSPMCSGQFPCAKGKLPA